MQEWLCKPFRLRMDEGTVHKLQKRLENCHQQLPARTDKFCRGTIVITRAAIATATATTIASSSTTSKASASSASRKAAAIASSKTHVAFFLPFVAALEFHRASLLAIKKTMSDDEPIDQKEFLENECARNQCAKLFKRLVRCTARVQSHDTTETCAQELFELSPCVDRCVAKKLFTFLK